MGREDPLEKGVATRPSVLAWKIPWIEEPGGLQSMESQRVGHDLANKPSMAQHMGQGSQINNRRSSVKDVRRRGKNKIGNKMSVK